MKQTCFSYFLCGFKIKTGVYVWTCDEQSRVEKETLGRGSKGGRKEELGEEK